MRIRSLRPLFTHQIASVGAAAVLLVGPAAIAAAQAPATPSRGSEARPSLPDATAAVVDEGVDADDLRRRFEDVLRQYPPTLREVLRNDPSLLTDEGYLGSYPAVAAFARAYPQVTRNARFFVGDASFSRPSDPQSRALDMWNHMIEMVSIFTIMLLVATALGWLVRTVLDHRRWLRTSRIQVEVHQKLFDRLATNDDLLTYIQTPAGQRFLEAAPAPTDASPSPRAVTAPINRILWSVQIGIVLLSLGLGLQWVARQVFEEVAQLLWFVGVLAVTVGIGFVGSAGVAYVISRRLGLLREAAEAEAPRSPAPLA